MTWNGKLGNDLVAEGQAKPKPPAAYKIAGQSPPRFDVPAKVFGTLRDALLGRCWWRGDPLMLAPALAATFSLSGCNCLSRIP